MHQQLTEHRYTFATVKLELPATLRMDFSFLPSTLDSFLWTTILHRREVLENAFSQLVQDAFAHHLGCFWSSAGTLSHHRSDSFFELIWDAFGARLGCFQTCSWTLSQLMWGAFAAHLGSFRSSSGTFSQLIRDAFAHHLGRFRSSAGTLSHHRSDFF